MTKDEIYTYLGSEHGTYQILLGDTALDPQGICEILNGLPAQLSPKDKLMQAYEKAGLANALYVKKHYGKGSRG